MGAKKKTTKEKVNLSTRRPKGRGLPFDKLKAPSTVEGLEVHPEPCPLPRLESRGSARSNG